MNQYFNIYLSRVLDEQDKILFNEAIISANMGMYRGAYILVWLSCIESLKRRFKECGKQGDKNANNHYSQLIKMEKEHHGIDFSLLERAKNYGFINDFEFEKLKQMYTLRCVFAHPYENAPSKPNVESAISDVVDIVLSKPTFFGKDYIDNLLKILITDINYLSDSKDKVINAANGYLSKLNPENYQYFFEQYITQLEILCKQNTPQIILINRAVWFIEEIINKTGYDLFNEDVWHSEIAVKYPYSCIELIKSNAFFYKNVGTKAQDYLISQILSMISSEPAKLQIIENLSKQNMLTKDNLQCVMTRINQTDTYNLIRSGIKLPLYISKIHKDLQSVDYNVQNMAIDAVKVKENDFSLLPADQLQQIGREIHKAAEGGAYHAQDYLNSITASPNKYPLDFLLGICNIISENNGTYLWKGHKCLEKINKIINNITIQKQKEIIDYVNNLINDTLANIPNLDGEEKTLENISVYIDANKYTWLQLSI